MELITNPDAFLERQKDIKFAIPLAVVLVAAILSAITAYFSSAAMSEAMKDLLLQQGFSEEESKTLAQVTLYVGIISAFVMTFVVWAVVSLMLHGISGLFGGVGSFKTLLKLVAFSYIPSIILSPVNMYFSYEFGQIIEKYGVLEGIKAGETVAASTGLIGVAVLLWQYVYWTFAVKNAEDLPLKKAAICAAIPLVVMLSISLLSLYRSLATL